MPAPTLVVLAAGAGARYGGPKQLAPVGPAGEWLLEYAAYDAVRAGFERVVLVVRAETESTFRGRLDAGMARRVPVVYVHQRLTDVPVRLEPFPERERPWGTGHALLATEPVLDGPFAVVNADDFYGAESYSELAGFLAEPRERSLAVVGFRVADTLTEAGPVSRALLELGSEGRLSKIVERLEVWRENGSIRYREPDGRERSLDGDALVSMNMWAAGPEALAEIRDRFAEFLTRSGRSAGAEFLLPDVVQAAIRDGRLRVEVLRGAGEWCGITFREDQERVSSILAGLVEQGRYPRELWV